jgi:hypothetical protein
MDNHIVCGFDIISRIDIFGMVHKIVSNMIALFFVYQRDSQNGEIVTVTLKRSSLC